MSTPLQEQDECMRRQGFHPDEDYEYPEISPEEGDSLMMLRNLALDEKTREKFLEAIKQVLFELGKAGSSYDVTRLYERNKELIRIFSRIATQGSSIEDFLKCPVDNLFGKLDLRKHYEECRDFIINDGGETREGTTYEKDETTPRKGWLRFYWK